MVGSSDQTRSWIRTGARAARFNPFATDAQQPPIDLGPVSKADQRPSTVQHGVDKDLEAAGDRCNHRARGTEAGNETGSMTNPPDGASDAIAQDEIKLSRAHRLLRALKMILCYSWINILLVFVPVGIAVHAAHLNHTVIFVINALAIVPLAALLGYATESIARRMGDTVGALMNVTFGNAVELIILFDSLARVMGVELVANMLGSIIALVKNEIRIVQSSLVGSILANLLLIMGMGFLLGGLRFREQIYNSTVTQMSACLLSLSVTSLLLPTAFHAAFTDNLKADRAVLKVSRGTSVILLFIYVLYLLFQLKSHAYMYQSTPQQRIDEESHPGVLANIMNSSSSSSSSSSSNTSDSDSSSGSDTTAKRIRRVMRKGRRRRKSSVSSKEQAVATTPRRQGSEGSVGANMESLRSHTTNSPPQGSIVREPELGVIASGDEADIDGETKPKPPPERTVSFKEIAVTEGYQRPLKSSGRKKRTRRRRRELRKAQELKRQESQADAEGDVRVPRSEPIKTTALESNRSPPVPSLQLPPEPPRHSSSLRRPLRIRDLSFRSVVPGAFAAPEPSSTTSNGFLGAANTGISTRPGPVGVRRTLSLPERLNQHGATTPIPSPGPLPYFVPVIPVHSKDDKDDQKHLSRTAAIFLLLSTTALVAVCAEFLLSSINDLVEDTGISEVFVGLIILPIIGNAAEHITAVTVAAKNKMDLAIGVAVGSSIQIALFVTPVVVLIGWILKKEMSLYFTIFETISLFVSAFIVNFLVLDGRSNYLEGALLCAAYVIIGYVYPSPNLLMLFWLLQLGFRQPTICFRAEFD
ncbi:MAG: hypothetical protein M1823_006034 [Watsoniomyces obsoletus]|nr:MAG: hypothetical protein M1823_006034 [Watsoniomyces obsoletus]